MREVTSSIEGILVGNYKITPEEMCFVQYLPIKMKGTKVCIRIPQNLKWTEPLVLAACKDMDWKLFDYYIYLTVKHLYVTPDNIGNRPGWHIDGYLSDDINYIWWDKHSPVIAEGEFRLVEDHEESLHQMNEQACFMDWRTFPDNSFLRLDNTVVHKSPEIAEGCMRAFVKISVSKHKYNLQGNAHNHLFDYNWQMHSRSVGRNHPYVV